jgi:Flp pilus assembly pilin Flp
MMFADDHGAGSAMPANKSGRRGFAVKLLRPGFTNRQSGQSMVEYTVILAALTAALLLPGLGSVGTSESDTDSLLKAVADKHRGQGYVISLSEMPESNDLLELADYYDRLGKYPELSAQLRSGSHTLGQFTNGVNQLTSNLLTIKNIFKNPKDAIKDYFPPKIGF